MTTRRRIAVATGSRAEYGLLRPLLRALAARDDVALGLFVSAMHLARSHGDTVSEIEADGFAIWSRDESLLDADSETAICKAMALTTIGASEAIAHARPDLVLGLGDRFELLAVAQAAMIHKTPIAHLHGGEATEGLIDEAIRHAVTKMAHLHFTSTEAYRRRVIQLGEAPDRVFNVGALGLDNVRTLEPIDRAALAEDLGLPLGSPLFLATYHPVTLASERPGRAAAEFVAALERFPDATVVMTAPNADTFASEIMRPLQAFASERPGRALLTTNLGVRRYLSLMAHADVVLGNSSSGLLEAPAVGTPTVDVGPRQRGRVAAPSVRRCAEDRDAIAEAIGWALSEDGRAIAARRDSPYGDGRAAGRIAESVATHPLDGLLMKAFHDAPEVAV